MRVIKPGKLGVGNKESSFDKASSARPNFEVWDDFTHPKKVKKKKEFERGAGDRMVQSRRTVSTRERLSFSDASEDELLLQEVAYAELEGLLGIEFVDRQLLEIALTHRSAQWQKGRSDYERLEFLGDAVLDLGIADLLSEKYTDAKEGDLSKMRAALVNTEALAQIARELNLGPHIRLGRGEASTGGMERPSILADVMEAIIGAIYRDKGFYAAHEFVSRVFGPLVERVTPSDPKTELQEILHATGSEPPQYLLELMEGPDHAPIFVVIVIVDGEVCGRGRSATKKSAQRLAASEALLRLVPSVAAPELVEGQREILPAGLLSSHSLQVSIDRQLGASA